MRNLDGIWYVRDPGNPHEIGTPVWSDHPGDGFTRYVGYPSELLEAEQVGNETLRDDRGWSNTPKRYSYYPFCFDGVGGMSEKLFVHERNLADPRAVVSYGVLPSALDGGIPFWRPGNMMFSSVGTDNVATGWAISGADDMKAARTGFKNGWLEVRSETDEHPDTGHGASSLAEKRSRILPLNFEVAAFIEAINTCVAHEIGSYFQEIVAVT